MKLSVHFDGSYGPSQRSGIAAWGFIIKDENEIVVYSAYGKLGKGGHLSSNCAEYEALYQAMVFITEYYPDMECHFYGDSNLVITQMNGEAVAHEGKYIPFYEKVIAFATPYIGKHLWSFSWIPREMNSEADELSQYGRFK